MADIHYLGEFPTFNAVWKMFPNGGGYGDYVTILGVRYDWDESTNSWGDDPGDVNPALPEVVNHDIDVQGTVTARDGIKTADYIPGTAGAFIDGAGNAEFRSVDVDAMRVQDPLTGDLLPLPDFIKKYKTELPPDWADYEQIIQFDNVRILAFDPLSQEKFYTTIGALKKLISDSIAAGSTGGGTFDIEILRSDDPGGVPTDNNVLSSLATLLAIQAATNPLIGQFLSKIDDDTASGLITFLKGLVSHGLSKLEDVELDNLIANGTSTFNALVQFLSKAEFKESVDIEKGATFGNYITGLLGTGAKIDEYGHGELDSLSLRKFLEVPELRYNRTEVITGILWQTKGKGLIEDVVIDTDGSGNPLNTGTVYLKLEDGEYGAIAEDDKCMGIFHNFGGGNATEDSDDLKGNMQFAGFSTSYFLITEIVDTQKNSVFKYQLREVSSSWSKQNHPQPAMTFACYSNKYRTDRQASAYQTTDYAIMLRDMTEWEFTEANIYHIQGKLDGFKYGDQHFHGHGSVMGNAYLYGTLQGIEDIIRENIQVGGKNLLREHALQFAGKYWGGDVEWKDIDIDALIELLVSENNKLIMTENNVLIEF